MLDTDGNGKRDAYVEPDQPVDAQKDMHDHAEPGRRFDVGYGRRVRRQRCRRPPRPRRESLTPVRAQTGSRQRGPPRTRRERVKFRRFSSMFDLSEQQNEDLPRRAFI
jgi:hypothetical protein